MISGPKRRTREWLPFAGSEHAERGGDAKNCTESRSRCTFGGEARPTAGLPDLARESDIYPRRLRLTRPVRWLVVRAERASSTSTVHPWRPGALTVHPRRRHADVMRLGCTLESAGAHSMPQAHGRRQACPSRRTKAAANSTAALKQVPLGGFSTKALQARRKWGIYPLVAHPTAERGRRPFPSRQFPVAPPIPWADR